MIPTVPDEVWALLEEWLPDNDDPARPEMTLATVDESGAPDARTVLLSEYDRDGFYLHTDSFSRKVGQLDARPAAALVLRWPDDLRQLVVRGLAERADAVETDRAYALRSPYLQQLAWVNTAAVAQLAPAERQAEWADFGTIHPVLDPPPTWIGFLIRPTSLTFWTGNPDSVSHRREYRLGASGWARTELPG